MQDLSCAGATCARAAATPSSIRAATAPGARSLEGFLFPATYELKKGRPARALVGEQLKAFKRNFAKVDLRYARRKNLTPYDVLIIASLIDREAAVGRERAQISSVIYNRLKSDISLGIDATVRFIYGNWSRPLKQSELANPSPYNTRVNPGLPPGPIGNPGLASIKAAARPARTGYLFYVAAVCGNGRHKFAKTDAEFQRYVDEYNRAREERGGKSPTQLSSTLAGVLGFPVAHSRSPAMMNAAFAELGLDWRYLRLPVPAEPFAETVGRCPPPDIAAPT